MKLKLPFIYYYGAGDNSGDCRNDDDCDDDDDDDDDDDCDGDDDGRGGDYGDDDDDDDDDCNDNDHDDNDDDDRDDNHNTVNNAIAIEYNKHVFGFAHLRSVMHDGAEVVGQACVCVIHLQELTAVVAYVFFQHPDVIVPVPTLLLVPQTESVAYLMHRGAELDNTTLHHVLLYILLYVGTEMYATTLYTAFAQPVVRRFMSDLRRLFCRYNSTLVVK